VNSSPDDVRIRLLRAYQSFRLPEAFFRRTASAIADFEYLAGRYEKDSSVFSRETYHQILYDLGVAQRRLGMQEESSRVWKKLLSLRPNAKYKAMIEKERGDNLFRGPFRRPSLENRDAYYKEATRLHDLGVAGNKTAVKLALDMWQKAYEKNPGDALARAYYGSSLALSGRDATDPNTMFSGGIKGLVHINRALSRDRNNHRIRLLRAYLAYSLPEAFFHQTQRAVKDFRRLAMAYEMDQSIFSREVYLKLLYDLGEAYQRTGDNERAQKVWSRLLSENPGPKYVELLRAKVGNAE
jgi:tetratricopeptide (TPR) repeat protein